MLPEMRCGKGDHGRDWRSRRVPAHALDWISGSGSAGPKRQAVLGLGLGWEWAHSEQQRQSMPQAQHLMRWGIGLVGFAPCSLPGTGWPASLPCGWVGHGDWRSGRPGLGPTSLD